MAFGAGNILGRAVFLLSTDASKFNQGLKDAHSRARELAGTLDKQGRVISRAQANVLAKQEEIDRRFKEFGRNVALVGAGMTAFVTVPLVKVGVAAVKAAAQVEMFERRFKAITGSAEESANVMERLKEFAEETPLRFNDLADAASKFLITGMEIGEVIPILEALGNATLGDVQALDRAGKALIDVRNIGRLQAQEVRQFKNAFIDITSILAEYTGKSKQEIVSLREEGLISFELVRDALLAAAEEGGRFHGVLSESAQSLIGLWTRLGNNLQFAGDAAVESLLPALTKILEAAIDLTQWFTELDETTRKNILIIAGGAAVIGPILTLAGAFIFFAKQLKIFLVPLRAVFNLLKALGKFLGTAAGAKVIAFLGSTISLTSFNVQGARAIEWMDNLTSAYKNLGTAQREELNAALEDGTQLLAHLGRQLNDLGLGGYEDVSKLSGATRGMVEQFQLVNTMMFEIMSSLSGMGDESETIFLNAENSADDVATAIGIIGEGARLTEKDLMNMFKSDTAGVGFFGQHVAEARELSAGIGKIGEGARLTEKDLMSMFHTDTAGVGFFGQEVANARELTTEIQRIGTGARLTEKDLDAMFKTDTAGVGFFGQEVANARELTTEIERIGKGARLSERDLDEMFKSDTAGVGFFGQHVADARDLTTEIQRIGEGARLSEKDLMSMFHEDTAGVGFFGQHVADARDLTTEIQRIGTGARLTEKDLDAMFKTDTAGVGFFGQEVANARELTREVIRIGDGARLTEKDLDAMFKTDTAGVGFFGQEVANARELTTEIERIGTGARLTEKDLMAMFHSDTAGVGFFGQHVADARDLTTEITRIGEGARLTEKDLMNMFHSDTAGVGFFGQHVAEARELTTEIIRIGEGARLTEKDLMEMFKSDTAGVGFFGQHVADARELTVEVERIGTGARMTEKDLDEMFKFDTAGVGVIGGVIAEYRELTTEVERIGPAAIDSERDLMQMFNNATAGAGTFGNAVGEAYVEASKRAKEFADKAKKAAQEAEQAAKDMANEILTAMGNVSSILTGGIGDAITGIASLIHPIAGQAVGIITGMVESIFMGWVDMATQSAILAFQAAAAEFKHIMDEANERLNELKRDGQSTVNRIKSIDDELARIAKDRREKDRLAAELAELDKNKDLLQALGTYNDERNKIIENDRKRREEERIAELKRDRKYQEELLAWQRNEAMRQWRIAWRAWAQWQQNQRNILIAEANRAMNAVYFQAPFWMWEQLWSNIQKHFDNADAALLRDTGPKPPEFAQGGIITQPTYGLIGEAGPEAVIPLDRMSEMGYERGPKIKVVIQGGNYYGTQVPEEFASKIEKALQKRNRW